MLKSVAFIVVYFAPIISCVVVDYDDWSVEENALYPSLPIAAPWSNNKQCRKDSRLLMTHLKNKTYWAVQMWDASAKTGFGMLYGNLFEGGNFDECMLVKEPIESQYCYITMKAVVNVSNDRGDLFSLDPDPHSVVWKKFKDSNIDPSKYPRDNVTWGLCVPASCSWKDMNESLNHHVQLLNSKAGPNDPKYVVDLSEDWHCTKQTELEYSWNEKLFWITLASLIAVQIIAALYDPGDDDEALNGSRAKKLLMSFSFRRNFSQLIRAKPDHNELKQLRILYSAKFISIFVIVLSHRAVFTFASPLVNFQSFEAFSRSYQNLFGVQGDLVVDTFFFVSGILACYGLLEIYTKKFVNPIFVIFGRWIKLAPLYYFLIWFHASVLARFGSGPIWKLGMESEVDKCQKSWWLNVLFLNNYVNVKDSCMIHTWFLSCEMHLFIICTLLVMLIAKNEKLGVSVLGISTVVTMLIPGIITYSYKLKPLILFYPEFLRDSRSTTTWLYLYVPTHARATVYLMGMITAYIIYKTKTSKKKLPPYSGGPLLILCLGLLFAPMVYGSLYYDPSRPYNVVESSIFAVFRRPIWGLGCFVCMMVYCFGNNFFLKYVSEVRLYWILSRLTYAIYLIHFFIQGADTAMTRIPRYFSLFHLMLAGFGDVLASVLLGAVLYLLIELPFKKFFHELLFSRAIAQGIKDIQEKENKIQLEPCRKV